jgi:RNA polymerase sigma-70 factor (ECF subfamily)
MLLVMTMTADDEDALVAALKDRDEAAFAALVDLYTPAMLRVARGYVSTRELAEDVVQETWIALLKGIGSFEGRSSLRTWLFTILINIAKRKSMRERRDADVAVRAFTGGTVDPARFRDVGDPYPGHWRPDEVPSAFPDTPEGSVLGEEFITLARRELDKLPERQRLVVMMRDMLGLDSAEVCELLDISTANQRVLLHRGRAGVRQILEDYVRETG